MTDCAVLGILDDGWAGLNESARARLAAARCVIGAERTLALVSPHLSADCATRCMDGRLAAVLDWVTEARAQGKPVVVLATGDPLCHGIGAYLITKLGAAVVDVLPAISTLQLAYARLKRAWQDVRVISVHAADAGEWDWNATPDHGFYGLLRSAAEETRIACFTSPVNGPDRIARALLRAGYADEWRISVAARLCLPDEALFADMTLEEAAGKRFPDPNVVALERVAPRGGEASFGFDDGEFNQRQPDKGLITKREARALSLALMAVSPGDTVWDIGAGSGAVGIEAASLARRGHVWAIEKNTEDAANARANARHFRATNYTLAESRAPAGLDAWPDPDAVFVGGSGGELAALIELIWARLKPGGRLVMNFVTFENLAAATAALESAGAAWQVTQLSAARSRPILDMHRLAAENPVWIVSARKETQ